VGTSLPSWQKWELGYGVRTMAAWFVVGGMAEPATCILATPAPPFLSGCSLADADGPGKKTSSRDLSRSVQFVKKQTHPEDSVFCYLRTR